MAVLFGVIRGNNPIILFYVEQPSENRFFAWDTNDLTFTETTPNFQKLAK
jgi:hypothetical protein